ncbi:putative ATP-binding cassette transporter [Alphaentomopoxvirus acuprea]|uniref:Putative ATP-binding cassette transporter n=1 Tax=Alphaentomopoxvirus acuprea TaxID=62099 RepID=W6JKT0_9POXV|nr:ABC transporter [Anomala cuprea entomopoxvirus]BAO49385.1 putative ATP-binding cassette transporter [Anomala cuprea entomopoxvirus]
MLLPILWKHLITRFNKISSIILTVSEILIPILTIVLVLYYKSKLGNIDKIYINSTTYNDKLLCTDLLTELRIGNTKILYSPSTIYNDDLINRVKIKLNLYSNDIKYFQNEKKLIEYYNTNKFDDLSTIVVIIFNNTDKNLKYDIRIYENGIFWNTDKLFTNIYNYDLAASNTYITKSFNAIQLAIDISYIEMVINNTVDFQLTYQEFPYPPYLKTDNITISFRYILPFIIILGFILICPITLKTILMEKSSGLKELLKINGVKSVTLWIGWFLNQIIINIVSVIFICIILTTIRFSDKYRIIEHCNPLILIIFLLLYCSSTITFFFAFSTLFNKIILSMIMGILLWISIYCIFIINVENINDTIITNILLLFPPCTLYYGFDVLSLFEMRNTNINFDNLFESPAKGLSIGLVIIILFIDSILYFLIALYLDKLWPGKYGTSSSINMFNFRKKKTNQFLLQDLNSVIQLKNVSKIYNKKIKVIDDISFDIKKNKISILLGNNGAGKSTLMSMIMRMTSITSGHITGIERNKIAYCPQDNLLYKELTVIQHLILCGLLHGLNKNESKQKGEYLLKNVLNMIDKKNLYPNELSGGMKRKLSLGIALMTNPDVLILDEPTSSIDIEGRQEIYNLILSLNKTVLISTHLLEEAEYLADYIIIINSGKLLYYGNIIDLKNKYDIGYICTIKNKSIDENKIKEIVGHIKIKDDNIICNIDKTNKNKVPLLLKYLDELNIEYLFSSISLNDLYIKVQNKEIINNNNQYYINHINQSLRIKINYYFNKRKLFFIRKIKQYLYIYIISLCIIGLSIYLSNFGYVNLIDDGNKIKLDLDVYGHTDIYYSLVGQDSINIITHTSNSLIKVDNVNKSIIDVGINNIVHYIYKLIIAFEFNFTNNSINIMYSNKAYHSMPIAINVFSNTLLNYYTNDNYSIYLTHTPLHSNNKQIEKIQIGEYSNLFIWSILLPIGPLILISTSLLLPAIDYVKNIKTLERLCNIKAYQYWLFNYVFDITCYIASISIILIIIYIMPIHYLDVYTIIQLGGLFILYGIVFIPQSYIFTYMSTVENTYFNFLIVHIFCSPLISVILIIIDKEYIIILILLLSPHTSLCYYLASISIKLIRYHNWNIKSYEHKKAICSITDHVCCNLNSLECNDFKIFIDYKLIFCSIISLCISIFILLSMNYITRNISKLLLYKQFNKTNTQSTSNNNILYINNVSKGYWKWPCNVLKVINDITIVINNNICFGLLGTNGAGKTTMFKMMTNEIEPTIGKIKINGTIGYCPQQDSLIDEFTGKELLYLYGKLRGITNINHVVNKLLIKFDLCNIANQICGTYSGGNKRKLSTCLSLIGYPNCVLLDEPTNGIDPITRNELWDVIEYIKKKSIVILSSHNVHDCEKLCDNLCILHKGIVKEQTSIKKLKNKYCIGHILKLKFYDNKHIKIEHQLHSNFDTKNIKILSNHDYMITVRILNYNWITIFDIIERIKNDTENNIEDYWIMESTLDEALIEIANNKL